MQSDHKQIAKITSVRTGKSEQMYKDLGNFVMTEVQSLLKRPKSLIIKLKGVGSWHLRKKRMQIIVEDYPDRLDERAREEFPSDVAYQEYLFKKETYLNFQERLKEYEEYLTIKKQVRLKRNETQVLLKPTDDENKILLEPN